MIWFQAAFDREANYGQQWVVLQMRLNDDGNVWGFPVARYPTRHEAQGHSRKNWERLP
jgi:hypothetical protein